MKTNLEYIYEAVQKEIAFVREIMQRNDCGTRSMYWQFDNKLIRVGDHRPNEANIEAYNEGVEEVLLIMVGDVNEIEISNYCESASINTDYLLDQEEMQSYNAHMIRRFMGL